MVPDQQPDDETGLTREHNERHKAETERAQFKIPAEVGVAARTFDKYAELSHSSGAGEEARVRTIEEVNAKMKAGGVDAPELLFANIALSLLPDELITPAVAEAKNSMEENASHSLMESSILIEQAAEAQPDHVIFRNPIQSDKSTIQELVHTDTKARAAVFGLILEQDASVYAVAREFGQSKTNEEFGKGIGPAIISAYENASRIVENNPDPYILAGVLQSMKNQATSEKIRQEVEKGQKYGATKYKFANIVVTSNVTFRDLKTKNG